MMEKSKHKFALGIDLGTTYSVFQKGKPDVISSSSGNMTIPSIAAFTDIVRIEGQKFKEELIQELRYTMSTDSIWVLGSEDNEQCDSGMCGWELCRHWRPGGIGGTLHAFEKLYTNRFIWKTFNDHFVQETVDSYPFKVEVNGNRINFMAQFLNQESAFSPEEISSAIHGKLKTIHGRTC